MTRVLTAIAIIGPLLLILWLPWPAFTIAASVVGLLAWREYVRLAASIGPSPVSAPGGLLLLGVMLSFLSTGADMPTLVLLLATLLAAAAALRDGWRDPLDAFGGLAATLVGLVWIGMLLGTQVGLRRFPDGNLWLLLLYATVAAGDSAAYYGGRTLGRHKLAPYLSPNKTIEGTVCGLFGSAAAAALVAGWIEGVGPGEAALAGVALGAFGQAGDLVESSLKRAAGVKDSSDLLPGHGGVLDRIDAHLPAGGLLYVILRAGWLA